MGAVTPHSRVHHSSSGPKRPKSDLQRARNGRSTGASAVADHTHRCSGHYSRGCWGDSAVARFARDERRATGKMMSLVAAAAAVAAATVAAATAATATAAPGLVLGKVDAQGATVELRAVLRFDGARGVAGVGVGHEAEAA